MDFVALSSIVMNCNMKLTRIIGKDTLVIWWQQGVGKSWPLKEKRQISVGEQIFMVSCSLVIAEHGVIIFLSP